MWKIILGIVALVVVSVVVIVAVMAIADAKEEMRDIQEADKGGESLL